ncbi:MAG: hypothetical protein AB7H80_07155 [Candidatus Kapaibacterium sp.]
MKGQMLKISYLIAVSVLFSCLLGCNESTGERVEGAAAKINDSESQLVRVSENSKAVVKAKYLTPEYLALAEAKRSPNSLPLDSLRKIYRKNLSFSISLHSKELPSLQKIVESEISEPESNTEIELYEERFSLSDGINNWHPVLALPEQRTGEAEEHWFVVFAVDPSITLRDKEDVTLTYNDPERKEISTFTYTVADFIHPEPTTRID